jgi:inhibitor of KinA sporulation pathway (predicted exonuclease)
MTQTLHTDLSPSTLVGVTRLAQLREQPKDACLPDIVMRGLSRLVTDLSVMHASTVLSKLESALDDCEDEASVATFISLPSADALKVTRQADSMAITVDYLLTLCVTRELQESLPIVVRHIDIPNVQSILDLLRQQPTVVIMNTEQTCWKGSLGRTWSGSVEAREVIQIGAVTVDTETFSVISEFNVIVQPDCNQQLSTFCTELTGITQDRLEQEGVTFLTAYDQWDTYSGSQLVLVYRADDDVLRENLAMHGKPRQLSPFLKLRSLLEACGVNMEGINSGKIGRSLGSQETFREHDALADVRSMAAGLNMLARLIRPQSIVTEQPSGSVCSEHRTRQEACMRCQTDLTDDPAFTEMVAEAKLAGLCTCTACGFGYYRTVDSCPMCNASRVVPRKN